MNQPALDTRQSQINEQTSRLESLLEEAARVQDELEMRLSPVTRSEPPHPVNAVDSKEDELVPLATTLRKFCRKVEKLNERKIAILRQLEL